MYSMTKFEKCPNCGKRDLSEGSFCIHCRHNLLMNPGQTLTAYWQIQRLQL